MGKHPEMPKRTASLPKKQEGKCPYCQLIFREDDVMEIDHITPPQQVAMMNTKTFNYYIHIVTTKNLGPILKSSLGTKVKRD